MTPGAAHAQLDCCSARWRALIAARRPTRPALSGHLSSVQRRVPWGSGSPASGIASPAPFPSTAPGRFQALPSQPRSQQSRGLPVRAVCQSISAATAPADRSSARSAPPARPSACMSSASRQADPQHTPASHSEAQEPSHHGEGSSSAAALSAAATAFVPGGGGGRGAAHHHVFDRRGISAVYAVGMPECQVWLMHGLDALLMPLQSCAERCRTLNCSSMPQAPAAAPAAAKPLPAQ